MAYFNFKTAGSRPRTPPYFFQTLKKYAKKLSTGVGRLEIRMKQSIFHRQTKVTGRYLFSRKATGAPSRFARQGMHRECSVVKARPGRHDGCFYFAVIPAQAGIQKDLTEESFSTAREIIAAAIRHWPLSDIFNGAKGGQVEILIRRPLPHRRILAG